MADFLAAGAAPIQGLQEDDGVTAVEMLTAVIDAHLLGVSATIIAASKQGISVGFLTNSAIVRLQRHVGEMVHG